MDSGSRRFWCIGMWRRMSRPIFIPQTLISTPAAWFGGSTRIGAAQFGRERAGNTARLIDVASTNTGSTNEWWVEISADGTNLTFNTSNNGAATVQVSGSIQWASNTWHQVVLEYGPSDSSLYVDGTDGCLHRERDAELAGVRHGQPGLRRRERFLRSSQMRGVLADLETYNYELSANGSTAISCNYNAIASGGTAFWRGSATCIRATSLLWRAFPGGHRPA